MPTRAARRKTIAHSEENSRERDAALSLINTQITDLHNLWAQKDEDFYEERQFYERVINRREKIILDESISEYSRGLQDLSEILEQDVNTNVLLLNLDEPRLDVISKETSKDNKEDVEDCRIWFAQSMARQNKGKVLGRAINRDQWTKGVACVEKRWKMPEEPDEDYYKSSMGEDYYDPAEDMAPDEGKAGKRTRARDEYYQSQRDHCFQSYHVNMYEMSWWPLLEPELYIRQFQLSYTDAKKILGKTPATRDKHVDLDQLGKLVFLGESDSGDNGDSQDNTSKKFDVVIRNHREPDGSWICTEWIKAADTEWSEGEQYDEYVIPFGRAMYFIIPSGSLDPTATNPHLMYRAPVYPEVSLVYKINFLNTLMLSLGRMQLSDNFFYLPGNKLSPEYVQAAEALGISFEGGGENRNMLLKRATPGSQDLQVFPGEILPFPFPEIKSFTDRLNVLHAQWERIRPNRLQTGDAISAAKEGTTTGLLSQKQAAQIPHTGSVAFEELYWGENAQAERVAMLFWQEGKEVKKPYYYRTSGQEPVTGGGNMPVGRQIVLDDTKLKRDFEFVGFKRNKTDAERHQDDLVAYEKYGQGALTFEQLLGALGFENPQKQEAELQREKYRKMVETELAPTEAMMVKVYASALWGTNLAELPLPQGATPAGGNLPKGPNPNEPAGNRVPDAGQVDPVVAAASQPASQMGM